MFNLFGSSPSYQGSALEGLINASPALKIEDSNETIEAFADALSRDYPQALRYFLQVTNQQNPFEEGKLREGAEAIYPFMIAGYALKMIMSASGMAQWYGGQIDQLKTTNAGAAFALASALAEYVNGCSVPAPDCGGGYRRHLSAYLILRDAMESFGFLAPWEQHLAAFETDQKKTDPNYVGPKMDAKATTMLRIFVPKSEQAIVSQVGEHLSAQKNTVGLLNLMPGILDAAFLSIVLAMPRLFATAQWPGSAMVLYTNGHCMFCGGSAPCRPCESRLIQIAQTSPVGYGGSGSSHYGPASMRAREILINAGIDPSRR